MFCLVKKTGVILLENNRIRSKFRDACYIVWRAVYAEEGITLREILLDCCAAMQSTLEREGHLAGLWRLLDKAAELAENEEQLMICMRSGRSFDTL